ncbi:MAG: OmpA family protein [Candidatus Krumholzibacteriia bacterium]
MVVQGHTDATGSAKSNQVLSLRRAETVRAELLAIGIRPDSVAAVGFGDTRPIADNDTPAGRAHNRRVDLQITMPSSSSN